jgi:hypothetical protein
MKSSRGCSSHSRKGPRSQDCNSKRRRKSAAPSAVPKALAIPAVPDYRRNRVPGGTFFFTVNLLDRRSNLLVANIDALRDWVRRVRARAPFHIDAWVVPPDHMHCLWTPTFAGAGVAARQCRFSGSVASDQDRVRKIAADRRAAITGHHTRRRTRHLAASVLGAHDPRRSRLCRSHGRYAFQPSPHPSLPRERGRAREGGAPGGLAAFVISPMRRERNVSPPTGGGGSDEPQQTGERQ